ncbi:MAG: hypothetical protein COA80_19175 [Leeuwenhoekiella sp.]|nr:MAG: hypothetical protein COA80_19175 [Leeuwenhoekiella sp.]
MDILFLTFVYRPTQYILKCLKFFLLKSNGLRSQIVGIFVRRRRTKRNSKRVTRYTMLQGYNSFYFRVLRLGFLLNFEQFATNLLLSPVDRKIFATNPI